LLTALLASSTLACTSTLVRIDQPAIEGELISSDSDHLVVRNEAGELFSVRQSEVADIHHSKELLVGSLFAGTLALVTVPIGLYLYFKSQSAAQGSDPPMPLQTAPLAAPEAEVTAVGSGVP